MWSFRAEKIGSRFGLVLFLATFILTFGCTYPDKDPLGSDFKFPMPTKDEILRVNGLSLSLSDYLKIKSLLRYQNKEEAIWVGKSILILDSQDFKSDPYSKKMAFDVARYALGEINYEKAMPSLRRFFPRIKYLPAPEEIRKELENLEKKAVVQVNPRSSTQYF